MPIRNDGDKWGGVVRMLREQQHLALSALADRTGLSVRLLSRVEHGRVSPCIASPEPIASALGVTLARFFTPTAAEPTTPVGLVASRRGLTGE